MPSKDRGSDKKSEAHQKKSTSEQKTVQPVIRTVREGSLLHCYLACGHMITMHKEDLKESSPSREEAGGKEALSEETSEAEDRRQPERSESPHVRGVPGRGRQAAGQVSAP